MAQQATLSSAPRRGTLSAIFRAAPGFALLLLLPACAAEIDLTARRASLMEADELYTSTANSGDVEGLTALYAPNATRYPPDGEPSHGLDAMRAFAEGVASTPGFHLTASRLALEVSEGGDMGYTLNLLELTVTGADGRPRVQWLRDLHVWQMEPDGHWRIVEDLWHVLEQAPLPEPVG